MNATSRPHGRMQCAGFSLIEMLVGVLIISFGLLGLMALQTRAVQSSVGTEDAQRAALLASEIAATMTNQGTTTLPATTAAAWAARVADPASGGLSRGVGTVTVVAGTARVKIEWTPPQNTTGDANRKYETDVVVIP